MDLLRYIPSIIFVVYVGIMIFILFIFKFLFPTETELSLFYYWHYEGIIDGLFQSWPIFLWAFLITLISLLLSQQTTLEKNILYVQYTSEKSTLFKCMIDCLLIGINEEILYRWLFFYSNMVGTKIMNFFSFGLCHWFYLNIEAPLINFFCFKRLGWLLYDQSHWSIGSGATIANSSFRTQHLYLGLFGYYNSWCIGFFLFWIMMHYGLPAAILSHAFYDFIIFSMYHVHGYVRAQRSCHYNHKYFTSQSASSLFPKLKESV